MLKTGAMESSGSDHDSPGGRGREDRCPGGVSDSDPDVDAADCEVTLGRLSGELLEKLLLDRGGLEDEETEMDDEEDDIMSAGEGGKCRLLNGKGTRQLKSRRNAAIRSVESVCGLQRQPLTTLLTWWSSMLMTKTSAMTTERAPSAPNRGAGCSPRRLHRLRLHRLHSPQGWL